jgi:hypothetical protein
MTPSFVPTSYAQALSRIFWPQPPQAAGENLYVLLDGARDRQIYSALRASEAQYLCLLPGPLHYTLAKAAPYLVLLEPSAVFSRWLMEQAWCSEWGIFLSAKTPLKQLQVHFADLLKAEDPSGAVLHFRYYDPRVFRTFVPTCRDEQRQQFFGPVTRYLVPAETPNTLIEYSVADDEIVIQPTHMGERLYVQSARPKQTTLLHGILDRRAIPPSIPPSPPPGQGISASIPTTRRPW